MIEPAKWDELVRPMTKQDFKVIQAVQLGLPKDWMGRSPSALVCGGAMMAVKYERTTVAEGIRNHVLFHTKPAEIVIMMERNPDLSRLVALNDQFFLDIANNIETGAVSY